MKTGPKEDADNHADQLNPNNDAYWQSRGYEERPNDWDDDDYPDNNDYYPSADDDDGSYLSDDY